MPCYTSLRLPPVFYCQVLDRLCWRHCSGAHIVASCVALVFSNIVTPVEQHPDPWQPQMLVGAAAALEEEEVDDISITS